MSYTPKDGSGTLFKNDKQGNPARPDYRGDGMVNGELVEIAGWIKEGKKGKFLSLSFKPKGERQERAPEPAPEPRQPARAELDDEIPF